MTNRKSVESKDSNKNEKEMRHILFYVAFPSIRSIRLREQKKAIDAANIFNSHGALQSNICFVRLVQSHF